ncbi:MAG: hypothetical protein Q4F24_13750 [Eubacteriales bacterium]|nr:hypothetical protein [Eubacteriales bacterium]
MLYSVEDKKQIEKVIGVFQEYINGSDYLDIVYAKKLGYILLKIELKSRDIMESIVIENAEELVTELFSEIAMDVVEMTGNDHAIANADPLERAEIERRLAVYKEKLPEYAKLADSLEFLE